MPILKLSLFQNGIASPGFNIVNISKDNRLSLLNKNSFVDEKYKIDSGVYLVHNDLFFKMAKMIDKNSQSISGMYFEYNGNYIIIVPSKSYVFWQGRSVRANEYNIGNVLDCGSIMKLLVNA
jgi:hypothetical protein